MAEMTVSTALLLLGVASFGVWFIWFLFDNHNLSTRVRHDRQRRCRESDHHPNCNCADF